MIRFEVTGATPEEFAENAMKAWGLLAIGLQAALAPERASLSGSPPKSLEISSPSSAAASSQSKVETSGSESSSSASKVPSDRMDDLFVEKKEATGPTPMDGSSRQTKKSDGPKTADPAPATSSTGPASRKTTKGPKLDDLKTRLSEVIVAATRRWDQKRANAHARKLLEEFEVAKLSDLASDRYGEFMARTADYLDGTAAE